MMVMQLSWLPVVGKKILGGKRQSGERIPAVVNPSVVGAAELGGTHHRRSRTNHARLSLTHICNRSNCVRACLNLRITSMQGYEIDRNRIGMHVQIREFKNTGFLPI